MASAPLPLPHRIEVIFVSPGGVLTKMIGGEMVRVRGKAFLFGTKRDDDLLGELGTKPRDRVPWESRSARRSALERIATGNVYGSIQLDPAERRRLLEHVASTPFITTEDD